MNAEAYIGKGKQMVIYRTLVMELINECSGGLIPNEPSKVRGVFVDHTAEAVTQVAHICGANIIEAIPGIDIEVTEARSMEGGSLYYILLTADLTGEE